MKDVWRFYQRHAKDWDAERGKPRKIFMERAYLDEMTSGLNAGAAILDLGCGTGEPMGSLSH